MNIELPPDFKEFLKILNDNQVKYLVIGGYAVKYHGYARTTKDLDVWIATIPENFDQVVKALRKFDFSLPEFTPVLVIKANKIVRKGQPPIRLEISTSISGVDFEECYASRIVDTLDGVQVNIIDLPHLKANKKAAGRLKDLADLEHLP
jgi:predicted nucleotidyltransferase